MRPTVKLILLSIVLIIFSTNPIFGYDVKLIEKIEFSPEAELPSILLSFCVTEDELIIIPDIQEGNIKIYEEKGNILELTNTLGRKGFNVGELAEPTFCFYDKNEGKFGVIDYGKGEIIIYDRIGRMEFQRTYAASCLGRGYDIQLSGNILLISGYKVDQNGKPYDLYYFDLNDLPPDAQEDSVTTARPTFLLPSYLKFGLKHPQEFNTKLLIEDDIITIGTEGWFDVQGEDVYFVWEGDLRILKINIKSREKSTFIGEKTFRYIKPHVSDIMRKARRSRNFKTVRSEMAKMSYIRNIFASPQYVLIVFEGPGESNFWMQFYTLDGNFIKEVHIPGPPGWLMNFNKDKDMLYSLSRKERDGPKYLMKYKISE